MVSKSLQGIVELVLGHAPHCVVFSSSVALFSLILGLFCLQKVEQLGKIVDRNEKAWESKNGKNVKERESNRSIALPEPEGWSLFQVERRTGPSPRLNQRDGVSSK